MADLSQYDPLFQAAGEEWNVDPTLLKAVAGQESGGNRQAVSRAGAQGLMQITPETQRYLGITDPNDPAQSIYGAAKYLNEGLDREGSPEGALLYYHGGPDWRNAYGPESRAYVPAVTARYVALKPPDQSEAAPAASTPQGPLILGDSLASKGGLGGSGVVGAQPKAVLDSINGLSGDQVNGRDVILSGGASNNPAQASLVYDQVQALKNKGANSVTVVGVGDRPDLQGVNDQLALVSGRAGARFVPLPTDQLSADRVHPTQQGYRTLLAAATPKVATDASPAPAPASTAPTGAGNAMASDDPLKLLPPAPQPSAGAAPSTAAAADDPLSLLPPAPKSMTSVQQGPPSDFDEAYGMMARPTGPTINALAAGDVAGALAPAPGRVYGNMLPWAADAGTGANGNISLPGIVRQPLQAFAGGVTTGQNVMIDPRTNALSLSPEASSVVPFFASPLRVGGGPTTALTADAVARARELSQPPPATLAEVLQRQRAAPTTDPTAQAVIDLLRRNQQSSPTDIPAPPTPFQGATAGPMPQPPGATATAATGPQPAGAAATPPGAATLTPAEVRAYQTTAEGNKLLENQRVGEPDRTAYIPGVTPNLAEQEQTVNAARELKSLGITSQEASQEAKLAAQANNDARTSYWNDTTRSPVDIQRAEAAREQQAQADLKAAWANKTDADASPVQDAANQILAGPDGKRKAVQSAVNSVLDELKDAKGNLETDPEILYGVRKHIGDMLSKEGQRETPLAARATDSLTTLRDTLDSVIESAAPGFKQYLQNFSNASRPIDEMQVLQDATPNLFKGPNATLRYGDFQRFMKNVVDMRQGLGVNPYKSISDDTMQRLWNLRDDLRRSAGAQELARAPGSDSVPNIIDAIKQYGKLGGGAAIDAAAAHFFGPAGPMMVRGGRAMLAPITAARTARAQQARMREMLYPSNPLTPP